MVFLSGWEWAGGTVSGLDAVGVVVWAGRSDLGRGVELTAVMGIYV